MEDLFAIAKEELTIIDSLFRLVNTEISDKFILDKINKAVKCEDIKALKEILISIKANK